MESPSGEITLTACPNEAGAHRYLHANQRIHSVAVLVLIIDVVWLVLWISTMVYAVETLDSFHAAAAGTTLSCPHMGIIPSLVTVVIAFREAIRGNKAGRGDMASMDFGWLLAPILAIPFDMAYARLLFKDNFGRSLSWGLATYGAFSSWTASLFMVIVYFEISKASGYDTKAPIKQGVQYFVEGLRPCVWKTLAQEKLLSRRIKQRAGGGGGLEGVMALDTID